MKSQVDTEMPTPDTKDEVATQAEVKETEATEAVDAEEAAPAVDFLSRLKIAELEKKVADYESKIGGIRDYVKNLESEMEAARLRAQRDQEKLVDQKLVTVFREILSVADNLDRSVKAAEGEKSSLADGIRMVNSQLQETFNRLGLEKLVTKGEIFNPELHEALTTVTVKEESLDQKIVEEVQSGFRYKGALVRAAQVVVGKIPEV